MTPFPRTSIHKENTNNGRNLPSCTVSALLSPFTVIAFTNEEATCCVNEEAIGIVNEAA